MTPTREQVQSGANFSVCRQYRYRLWRRWGDGTACCFIMLNPSTADESANDPTIERCQRRAKELGYDALEVVNIFALRSTDPKALYLSDTPVGPDNNLAILTAAKESSMVVCAWGAHGKFKNRGIDVLSMLLCYGIRPHALRINKDGTPAHPLYLPYSLSPVPL